MYIKEIWRFPVKSMAGEMLTSAQIGEDGVEGDRKVLVRGANGHVITSRTHYKLLGLKGTIGADGEVRIAGPENLTAPYIWNTPEALKLVKAAVGPGAELIYYEGPERFDVLPLLVATDGAIAEFGYDGRRLRPNIVIGGVEGLAERTWPGKCLRIGNIEIGVQDLRGRCVMTTYDKAPILRCAKDGHTRSQRRTRQGKVKNPTFGCAKDGAPASTLRPSSK